ncbi:MAG: helix-turn-helix transcriptional regulator [Methylophaga sp.]|nr:MAG: helix-turn-helix transcriptional regulator [Methylophaga sp.]
MISAELTVNLYLATSDLLSRELVEKALPDLYTISCFDTISSLQQGLQDGKPELVLCAQSLIEDKQKQILMSLMSNSPNSKILIFGESRPIDIQIEALKNGSRGYFDNSLPIEKLHIALQNVLHGEVWIERHVIAGLIDELSHIPEVTQQQQDSLEKLSPKETEVAEQVSYGLTNKMIASAMNISERTVKAHLTAIFSKLEMSDRLSLAIFFRDLRM